MMIIRKIFKNKLGGNWRWRWVRVWRERKTDKRGENEREDSRRWKTVSISKSDFRFNKRERESDMGGEKMWDREIGRERMKIKKTMTNELHLQIGSSDSRIIFKAFLSYSVADFEENSIWRRKSGQRSIIFGFEGQWWRWKLFRYRRLLILRVIVEFFMNEGIGILRWPDLMKVKQLWFW